MGKTLKRPCPVCGADNGNVLHRQVFLAPEELGVPTEVEVVACARCGACFADLPTTQDVLDEAYRDHSKYADTTLYGSAELFDAPVDSPWDLHRLEATANWLSSKVPSDAHVLDAGCATGALLGFLRTAGFESMVGLDPSPLATAIASRSYGVPTVTGSFLTPPADLGTFDLVILSHVLEHIADVQLALRGMWQMTRAGGCVYIEVPDAEHYVDHVVAPLNDFNTEHINHFSADILELAMGLAGFTTVTIDRKKVLCSPTDRYPVVYGLFRRPLEKGVPPEIRYDDKLVNALERYIECSAALMQSIESRIRAQAGDDPVVVWGAGQLSMKLLAGPLRTMKIVALVDTSEAKWGLHYGDLTVVGPEQVPASTSPILVTSVHHQASITASIRQRFPNRRIIVLRD